MNRYEVIFDQIERVYLVIDRTVFTELAPLVKAKFSDVNMAEEFVKYLLKELK